MYSIKYIIVLLQLFDMSMLLDNVPVDVLITLRKGEKNISKSEKPNIRALSLEVGSTYAHVKKTVDELLELDLVDFEKDGRSKRICLTPRGQELSELLIEARQVLDKEWS